MLEYGAVPRLRSMGSARWEDRYKSLNLRPQKNFTRNKAKQRTRTTVAGGILAIIGAVKLADLGFGDETGSRLGCFDTALGPFL